MRRTLIAVLVAFALAVFVAPPAVRAGEPELVAYNSTVASDGSVRLVLDFNAAAPSWQVVHAKRNDVKIVMIGVERGRNLPGMFEPAGEIVSAKIAPFAGIGLLIDLTMKNDVTPRAESRGSRLVVHIPAFHSDLEAHGTSVRAATNDGVTIIPLSYADVSEVAGLVRSGVTVPSVEDFSAQSPFAAPTPASSSSSSYGSPPTANAPSYVTLPTHALVPKDKPQGVYIDDRMSVDRRLNAVILRGTPAEIAPYERLIKLVDTPQRSVLLDTQIVELTETGESDLGINYSPGGQLASATFNAGTALGASAVNGSGKPSTSLSLSAKLLALQQKGQAKILAQPRILALDNRMAAILSGEAVPIFTNVVVPSGGTTILQQQLQYINVGVSLEILPRIAASGTVTADIFSEVSSILSYVQTAPRIAVRQELTAATVKDGQSVIIGGLLQDQEISSFSKIPGLGDIPILGAFFRSRTSTSQKTNLYLVITPHVLSKTFTDRASATPPPGN